MIIKKKTILHFNDEHTIHMNSKIIQNGYGIDDYIVSSRISYLSHVKYYGDIMREVGENLKIFVLTNLHYLTRM